MMERQRTNRDWEGEVDDRNFRRDILPGLQGVTLRRIMEATGLSKRFASQLRNGHAVPHRRHWDALLILANNNSMREGPASLTRRFPPAGATLGADGAAKS
jgi:hypothetical protein